MRIKLEIDNVYDGETIQTHVETDIPKPPSDRDSFEFDDWLEEHVLPLTGTGRVSGDAGYFVKVVECDQRDLVGAEFEFGI